MVNTHTMAVFFCRFCHKIKKLRLNPQGRCQSKLTQSPKREKSGISGRKLAPFRECDSAVLLEDFAGLKVAILVEMVVHRGMGRGKLL